jgi:hypothetical protein
MLKRYLAVAKGIEYDSGAGYEYNGEPLTGITYYINEKGFILEEVSYFVGLLWGFSRRWTSEGILREEYILSYGGADKGFKKWYLNGSLKEESFIEHGVVARRKQWNKEGQLIEDFSIENNPENNHYELWLFGKSNPDPEKTLEILEFEKQAFDFEQEIAEYLIKYPSSKFYHQNNFDEENIIE